MMFHATRAKVKNRGEPPTKFLSELVAWGRDAAEDIFAPNLNPFDIYSDVKPILGPWESPLHRRAAMLEVMRVHAGFESSWNWNEGVDVTNQTSMRNKNGEETGLFQVSFDTTFIANGAMVAFAAANHLIPVDDFIKNMKKDHRLALEYYARLVRVNIKWAGPLLRHEIDPWLSRAAVAEFMELIAL